MVGTVLLYCLLGIHLSVVAQPQDNKPQHSDGDAAIINGGKPVREEALLQVVEFVKREDSQLKERLQDSYNDLKELLKEGDASLKERVLEGDAQLKEQLKEGDSRLKEELDGDVAWLKGKIDKLETRMTEDLEKQRETCEKSKDGDEALPQQSSALMAELRKQMTDVQARLDTSQETVRLLQATVDTLTTSAQHQDLKDQGSTFTRWGNSSCPVNTSLVYSGTVGGGHWNHKGGASTFLCLVKDPQLDNTTAVPSRVNYVYGVEYEEVQNHHEQDAVCSVCRAPHSTTIMVPATLSCPAGWTTQYEGHLMSGQYSNDVNVEYVCVDLDKEHRNGGQGEADGGNFFYVVTKCGSLPCPPYVNNKIVTCVVCSL